MIIKKKLRDVNFEEYEDWLEKNCHSSNCNDCMFRNVICAKTSETCWLNHKDLYSDKFLDQEIEIEAPILTKEERGYLGAVIKPFRNRVISIEKKLGANIKLAYIYVSVKKVIVSDDFSDIDWISLPLFLEDSMYKGMELSRKYTLEELGLFGEK